MLHNSFNPLNNNSLESGKVSLRQDSNSSRILPNSAEIFLPLFNNSNSLSRFVSPIKFILSSFNGCSLGWPTNCIIVGRWVYSSSLKESSFSFLKEDKTPVSGTFKGVTLSSSSYSWMHSNNDKLSFPLSLCNASRYEMSTFLLSNSLSDNATTVSGSLMRMALSALFNCSRICLFATLLECSSRQKGPRPIFSKRLCTTLSAAIFSATNSTRFPW